MANRTLITLCIAIASAFSAQANLQLNFKLGEYQLDGVKFKHLVFQDGSGKEITYSPPAGWEYSGGGTKLTLHPPNKAQAEAAITLVALQQPTPLDEAAQKKLIEDAMLSVPRGSSNITLVAQERNPVVINNKETFLVTVAYTFYGGNYKRSIMFLNRGTEQLRFELVSRDADFADLQKAFIGSQFTWENL